MARAFLSVLFLLLLGATAWAGPFGTEMGDPPSKFEGLVAVPGKVGQYAATVLPKPHSAFEAYTLIFRNNGLSQVSAVSPTLPRDRSLQLYNTTKQALTKKYGKPLGSTDTICAWESVTLPDNLASIGLALIADEETRKFRTVVVYKYKNEAAAEKAQNAKDKDAL